VLGVAHLTSQLSAFVSMRLVLRNLLQPFLPPFLVILVGSLWAAPDKAVVESTDRIDGHVASKSPANLRSDHPGSECRVD
jgi:hypothetical protein